MSLRRSARRTSSALETPMLDNFQPPRGDSSMHQRYLTGLQGISNSGQFTVTDISNALGMCSEEKTMSRVLLELRRIHERKI